MNLCAAKMVPYFLLYRGCLSETECLGLGLESDPTAYWRLLKRKFRNVRLRMVS